MANIVAMEGFMGRRGWAVARVVGLSILALAGSSAVVFLLERVVEVPSAASVYLLAVIIAGALGGTLAAVGTAVAATLLYDFFFVEPIYTLRITDPSEWLNLLLFLAVGIAVGRLAGLQAERATEAAERARDAQALFAVSRSIATSDDLAAAAGTVLRQLAVAGGMDRLWLGLGPSVATERTVADTAPGTPLPVPTWHVVLQRSLGEDPVRWTRTHVGRPVVRGTAAGATVHRVRVEVPGEVLGSLWALRPGSSDPDPAQTRILSAAADQLGQAVRRERLVADGVQAEVSRRSEGLMSALLDSVSHDLRTPLATIRAAAGSLLDESVSWTADERTASLRSIDLEAERMNRLVRNLLDLSRIEGGALHPELEPHDLDDLLNGVAHRIKTAKTLDLEIPGDLPPLVVDALFLDEVLTNLIENAVAYGRSTIRVRARQLPEEAEPTVEVTVEDDGPGVPEADMGRLFDKFYRVRQPLEGSRPGMGIGLTVARGLSRAMRGDIVAERSDLGGLAVRVRVPAVLLPRDPEDDAVAADATGSTEPGR